MATPQTSISTHPFTCNTCLVAFKGSELQRGHMQSDWHRYNLKRRVASLPPLTSDIFTEKVLANQATAAATAAKATFEKLCGPCQKTYFSENAFRNHLGSQKHRQRVASMQSGSVSGVTGEETESMVSSAFSLGEPLETTSVGTGTGTEDEVAEREFEDVVGTLKNASVEEREPVLKRPSRPRHTADLDRREHPLPPSSGDEDEGTEKDDTTSADPTVVQRCLFCNLQSDSIASNTSHMHLKHGLFIPEQEYLVDLDGLIKWLHDRVSFLHECLYCGIIRHTTSGIQTHMRDKGHCMIAFDSEEQMVEVGQFYDFRSTYSDEESEGEEGVKVNGEPRLGGHRGAETVEVNGDADMVDGDAGWETDEEEDQKQNKTQRAGTQPIYHDEDGLHLPSGRTAGHRSLARYFRQNLHNYPTPEERASRRAIADTAAEADDDETASNRTLTPTGQNPDSQRAVTRANGGLGMIGVSDAKKHEAKVLEKADRRRAQRQQNRYQWGNERRANYQKHFRDPLLQ